MIINPEKRLILWNKLGITEEVEGSEVGPSFTTAGTSTFNPAKFNDGYYSNSSSNYLRFTLDGLLNHDALTISFWAKYTDFSVSSGVPSDASYHQFFWIGLSGSGASPLISFQHGPSFLYCNFFPVGGDVAYFNVHPSTGLDIAINDVVFYAIVYDKNQSSPNRTRLYYYNETSGQSAVFTETTSAGTPVTINFGASAVIQTLHPSDGSRTPDAILDNLKIYNYAKTDFSDRFVEYPIKAGEEFGESNIYTNGNKRLILWNKLGNADEVAKSEVGSSGTLTGGGTPTYSACQFDDGFYNNTAFEGIDFFPSISFNKGALEMYIKPPAVPASQQNCAPFGAQGGSVTYPNMQMYYQTSGTVFTFVLATSSGVQIYVKFTAAVAGYTSANQIMHFKYTWDASQGSGAITNASDVIRVFVDGTEITTFTDDVAQGGITYANMQSAVLDSIGINYSRGAGYANNIILDNLKIYNYDKEDNSDREKEYPIVLNGSSKYTEPDRQLIIWNKLGSTTEIENSEVGEDGTIVGSPDYSTTGAKFDEGVAFPTGNHCVNFPNTSIPYNQGCYECWIKTRSAWNEAYNLQLAARGTLTGVYMNWTYRRFDDTWKAQLINATSGYQITMSLAVSGLSAGDPLKFSSGDLFHVAISWDLTQSTNTERLKFFCNNVDRSSEFTYSGTWDSSLADDVMTDPTICGLKTGGNADWAMYGYMDNFKYWNYQKTDFSDKDNEYPMDLKKVITI